MPDSSRQSVKHFMHMVVKRAGWVLPISALFLLALAFFYDALIGDYLLVERDLGSFSIPPKFFWVESITSGSFPLWNPYNLFGQPFFSALQHAILYPLNLIFFVLPFGRAFTLSIILHIFLGGAFVYALLRDMEANKWASFIGAVSFMLGGYLLSVHSLLPTLVSVVWTPVIILFFRRALRSEGITYSVITGLMLTISFLGGGVEAVFGCLIALSIMVLFCNSIGGKGIIKAALSLSVAVLIFLGLSAVQAIPFLELGRQSIRAIGITYQEATTWSLAPRDIITLFITDPYGHHAHPEKYWTNQNWLKTLYIGFFPVILALFYFLKGKRERLLWLCIIFLSLFFAFGSFNPLHYYVYKYVPFFNKLRYPVKFLYLAILTVSITAGLGMQRLMEKKDADARKFVNAVFIVSFLSALILVTLHFSHSAILSFLKAKGIDAPQFNSAAVNIFNAERALFYLILYGIVLKTGLEFQWKQWTTMLLSIVLVGDLFGNLGYYEKMETKEYVRTSWAAEKIMSDKNYFRILVTPKTSDQTTFVVPDPQPFNGTKQLLMPSTNLLYKIHDVRGAEVMRVKHVEDVYKLLITSPSIDATNLADLFGIKYVVSTRPIHSKKFKLFAAHTEGLDGEAGKLLREPTIKIYKNQDVLPRAFLVQDVTVFEKEEQILSTMASKDFHPEKTVLLEEEPHWDKASSRAREKEEVRIIESRDNRLKMSVDAPRRSVLVLTDTYYPGWKVFVNGKARKIYRADHAFRAVPLEAGTYEVDFIYDPMSVKAGLAISLFTALVISVMVAVYYYRKRRLLE